MQDLLALVPGSTQAVVLKATLGVYTAVVLDRVYLGPT